MQQTVFLCLLHFLSFSVLFLFLFIRYTEEYETVERKVLLMESYPAALNSILENVTTLLPVFLGAWALFLFFTLWRPQRFRNSFFLMFALAVSVIFLSCFFGKYQPQALTVFIVLIILAIFLVPAMLITNGVYMIRHESLSPGNLLSLLLGIIIAVGEIAVIGRVFFLRFDLSSFKLNMILFFTGSSVFYFSVWILAFVLYMLFIQWMPHRRRFDYIVIHGCGLIGGERMSKLLSNRCDKAIQIYKRSRRKAILVPSGGQGKDEKISEAAAMKQYLLEQGIPEEHILCEDRSMTTMENLQNSFDLIQSRDGNHRTALVSSNYHVYRCLLYASKLKFRCTGIGAKVAWYYWPSATLREFVAVFTRLPYIIWLIVGYILFTVIPLFYFLK